MEKLLVKRAQKGDRDAFEQIYQTYRNYMLSIALHLTGQGGWAEDVVQDVFLRFIDSLETFKLRGSLKSYFAVCVANMSKDILRKQKIRKSSPLEDAGAVSSPEMGPLTLLMKGEQKQHLKDGLASIPYEQREVILLRTYGDMTFREIAKALDIPLKTAHSRYHYGLDKLRTFIDREGK